MAKNKVDATMPTGKDGGSIQVLAPVEGTVQTGTITGTSARAQIPPDAGVVEISVSADCRCQFGFSSVVASGTSRIMPKGSFVYKVPDEATHVAFVQLTGSDLGSFTVAKLN